MTKEKNECEESLREAVVVLMRRKGLRGYQVAERMGISGAKFSQKLSGKTSFTINDLANLADILGFSVDDILRKKDERCADETNS